MAVTLEEAFAEAAKLPKSEQAALAAWIVEEFASERRWSASFERSPDLLAALAAEGSLTTGRGKHTFSTQIACEVSYHRTVPNGV